MFGSSASGLVILPAKISFLFWIQAAFSRSTGLLLEALDATVVADVFAVIVLPLLSTSSGISFGKWVKGSKLDFGGLPLTNAVVIGDATRSNWFIGVRPRICSIVRVMFTCV